MLVPMYMGISMPISKRKFSAILLREIRAEFVVCGFEITHSKIARGSSCIHNQSVHTLALIKV